MPAYVSRPAIALPGHAISRSQLIDGLAEELRVDDPGLTDEERKAAVRALAVSTRHIDNSGVETVHWTATYEEALEPVGVAERAGSAFASAVDLALRAARQALAAANLEPWDIDAIVTSHTSSWTVPSLDVHLVNALGLRPTVSRFPIATAACAAGAQALIHASRYLTAHPGRKVLIAIGEELHTIHHRGETSVEHVIYRSLFSDGGAACIVSSEPLGPGLAIDDTLELVLPNSTDRYWGRIDEHGLHFDSTRKAATAAKDVLPYIQEWIGDRQPEWCAVHPGGPGIIADTVAGIGLDPEKHGRHSYASLRHGNLGGGAVLDVLRRTHTDPPAVGSPGVLAGFGPGFTVACVRGTWV